MNRKIFLTGERQVGKSTIIQKILAGYRGEVCGFQTLPEMEPYRRFYIKGVHKHRTSTEKHYIDERTNDGKTVAIPETFDVYGVKILEHCLKSSPSIILMDELGVFENQALLFQDMVYQCLDSDIPVIGVIKAKSSPFLNKIKLRPDVTLFHITKDNRDREYENILSAFHQIIK